MYKIKWKGTNTQQNLWWQEEANTYKDLWDVLEEREIVHYEQYERYLSNITGINPDDLKTDEEYYKWIESYDLSEEEWKDLIKSCDGNAYYQWFYEWNEEIKEYEEV